ncbi:MAG: endonuclease/exonuclease/phosphatase family protein, partial [Clostridia bacterium]|nr:endonuclease/exonuclease/phosphatase family protein [Clostridia bacterium]
MFFMKVMSFNVLCGGKGKNWWTKRKKLVRDEIAKYDPDTFGLQEAHYRWMNYLCKELGDTY